MPVTGNMIKAKQKQEEEGDWELAGAAAGSGKDELLGVWHSREICVTCKLRVNSGEKGLTCDLCRRWYHKECESVSKKDYDHLMKVDVKLKWFCTRCEKKLDDISAGYRKLEEKMTHMEGETKKLRKEEEERHGRVKKLEEETNRIREDNAKICLALRRDLEKVEQQMKEVIREETKTVCDETSKRMEIARKEAGKKQEKNLQDLREEMEKMRKTKMTVDESEKSKRERKQELEQMKNEVLNRGIEEFRKTNEVKEKKVEELSWKIEEIERERKKKNILIFNLPESGEEEASKRYEEDMEKCMSIFAGELEIQDLVVEKLIRIGRKRESGYRPLIVKLGSDTDRNTVLSKAKNLRHSREYSKVYLAKDLTEIEREKEKN